MHTCALVVLLSMPRISNADSYIVDMIGRWAYRASPAEFGKQRPVTHVNSLNLFMPPSQNSGSFEFCTVPNIPNVTFTNVDANPNPKPNVTELYEDGDWDNENNEKKGEVKEDGSGGTRRMLRRQRAFFDTQEEEDTIKNMAIVIGRGGCSIHQKILNVIEWNAQLRAAANPNEMNKNPSNVPTIELIIVANSDEYDNPSQPFQIVKREEEEDVDLFIVSIGNTHSGHLLKAMVAYAIETGTGHKMELDPSAFLPLDSPDRSVETDWVFPILDTSSYGQKPIKKFSNVQLMLIFICASLLFPVARFVFLCHARYTFAWRRNERGWINGITWTRRRRHLNLISTLRFMRETRRTTLTEEEVLALPVIRYGEEDINNLIEKHQPIFDSDDLSEADAPDNGNVDNQVESNGDNVTKYEDGDIEEGDNPTRTVRVFEKDNNTIEEKSNQKAIENKNDEGLSIISSKSSNSFKAAYTSCTMCSICICEFEEGEELRLLPACGHMFHTECILPWLTEKRNACPLCQKKVKVINDADDTEDENEDGAESENENSDRNDVENANLARLEEDYTEPTIDDAQGDASP